MADTAGLVGTPGDAQDRQRTPASAGAEAGVRAADRRALRQQVGRFQTPILSRSVGQVVTSFGGFLASCLAMYFAYDVSYWIVLALAPLAAGFLVRIFILQHDCGHGSLFRSKRANDWLGTACSLLTLTPFRAWRRQHAGHHGIWNHLDRRLSGADIYSTCLTVAEYQALGPWQRRWYRLTRHPLVANILLPPLVFLVLYRLPFDTPRAWRLERRSVHVTSAVLVALFGGLGLLLGFGRLAAIYLPIIVLASIVGVWLFSVQHRFETTLWARHEHWSPTAAALHGSSHLRLPRLLRWFTGNIGLHHVHHLNPKIPNYRLQPCHDAVAAVQGAPSLTLGAALRAPAFVLWDEARGVMVTVRGAAAGGAA